MENNGNKVSWMNLDNFGCSGTILGTVVGALVGLNIIVILSGDDNGY